MTFEDYKNVVWGIIGCLVLLLFALVALSLVYDAVFGRLIKEVERRASKNHTFLKERVSKLETRLSDLEKAGQP